MNDENLQPNDLNNQSINNESNLEVGPQVIEVNTNPDFVNPVETKVIEVNTAPEVVEVKTEPEVVTVNTQPEVIQVVKPQVINTQPEVVQVNQTVKVVPSSSEESFRIESYSSQSVNFLDKKEEKKASKKLSSESKKNIAMIISIILIILSIVGVILYFVLVKKDKYAFKIDNESSYGTYELPIINVPDNPVRISEDVYTTFVNDVPWYYSIDPSNNAVYVYTDYNYFGDTVTIPDYLDGHPVKHLGKYSDILASINYSTVFTGLTKNIKNVLVPNGVESLGRYAFAYMDNLDSITLPSTIKYIYNEVFFESINLSKMNSDVEGTINLPENLEWYGSSLFVKNTKINSFNFPLTINYLNYSTFFSCTGFTGELVIPSQFKYVYPGAFSYNSNITKLTLETGVKYVGGFYGDSALSEINLPNTVEAIEEDAFNNCISLKTVNYKGKLKYVGRNAISNSCASKECLKTTKDYINSELLINKKPNREISAE